MKDHTNSALDRKERRRKICKETGKCWYCPYHYGENKYRWYKHGKTKPKYKNKRG